MTSGRNALERDGTAGNPFGRVARGTGSARLHGVESANDATTARVVVVALIHVSHLRVDCLVARQSGRARKRSSRRVDGGSGKPPTGDGVRNGPGLGRVFAREYRVTIGGLCAF